MKTIFTIPNLISFLRIPLALVFIQDNMTLRVVALILAGFSDGLDGFIARRYKTCSRFGTFLDPFTDKFFVILVLSVFLIEQKLSIWEAATMLCRDFAVVLFGFYLHFKGNLTHYQFRAIWLGKITTTLQFGVLLGLAFNLTFSPYTYVCFIILGIAALGELYLSRTKLTVE